jgi:outer membrane protein TolC
MPKAAQNGTRTLRAVGGLLLCALVGCTAEHRRIVEAGWLPEQQTLAVRDPDGLPPASLGQVPAPVTVASEPPAPEPLNLSLNDAVRITLENAKAIRVFTGLGASNSGRSIYDAAIANTAIDQQQARFDPVLTASKTRTRTDVPALVADPAGPFGVGIGGPRIDNDRTAVGLSKLNTLGGRLGLNLVENSIDTAPPAGLNPQHRKNLELSYTQPLLQGGGFQFNMAPIVLARIDTERSYFQFKDATQELVRGTIEAYWNLVFSRLALWAAEIQYEQADEAYKIAVARRAEGLGDAGTAAQARVTQNQFQATLIAARADVLDREAALRNVIGLPPSDGRSIIPTSAPANLRFKPEWDGLLRFAERYRPDLIELKLILAADDQRRIQAVNSTLPQLDATALYRWNGLTGRLPPFGERLSTDHGQFADWSVGITFSVPLGLREGRARVREQDLIILRDKANLEQGLHAVRFDLALTVRQLESAYEQYLAFREMRAAAMVNLDLQINRFRVGTVIFLNVLQALNDWGNSIRSEARALTDYNILLATLEQQTGTILETHGLVFVEERFQAAGPHCLPGHDREYPRDLKPTGEPTRYPASGGPGENAFDLTKPATRPAKMKDLGPDGDKKGEVPPDPKFAEDRPK